MPPELTIVVPTYNERGNVAPLVVHLEAALPGIAWEVVFVDDDSPDGTAAEVRRLAGQDNRVRCFAPGRPAWPGIGGDRGSAVVIGSLRRSDGRRHAA